MTRRHKHWIHDFVAKVSPKSEAPERYLYWAAVVTLSGAVRRRCYLDMGTFAWYPNWYCVLVGPPGLVKKSTTIDVATRILREVPGVVFGSDCATWQQFVQEVAQADDTFATGGTKESLLDQEYIQSSAITFAISEFGTFFDPHDATMVNVLTEFWDGKDSPFRKATKTQGIDVINSPFVNLIAGTTPQWIADNFQRKFGGWGLSSRIIFLHASDVQQYIPYPDELWGDEIKSWSDSFRDDLLEVAQMEGPFTLDAEARAFTKPWYTELMQRIKAFSTNPNADPWISYYLQRKWSHVHKLALVLSISQRSDYRIGLAELKEAIIRCDEVEGELSRIFRGTQDVDRRRALIGDVGAAIVSGLWMTGGRCDASKIYRFTYRTMSGRETDELLSQMVKGSLIDKLQVGADIYFCLREEGKSILPPEERQRLEETYGDPLVLKS